MVTYLSRTSADHLVLLNRDTARRNEKHWLFAGRASVYCVLGWGTVPGRDRSNDFGSHITVTQAVNHQLEEKVGVRTYKSSTSELNTDQGRTNQQTICQDTQHVHQKIRAESLSVEEFRTATMNDPVLLEVMDILQNGNGVSIHKVEDLGPHKLVRSELAVASGILLR